MAEKRNQDDQAGKPADEAIDREDPIARSLRKVYDDVTNEPLPDHLQSLLDKLKSRQK